MDVTAIIIAVAIVGGVGVFIGIFLSFSAKAFYVETDPKETAVLEALPGNNCGGCGYPGCSGLAALRLWNFRGCMQICDSTPDSRNFCIY